MKKLLAIACMTCITLYVSANAIDLPQAASLIVQPMKTADNKSAFATRQATSLVMPMRSVNDTRYMDTGSRFRSTVSEVGSGISTTSYAGPRLAPPSVSGTTEDIFTNPQYGPIGDAIIPLLMMAMGYGVVLYRRRKAKELSLCD